MTTVWLPKQDLKTDINNRHTNMDGENHTRPHPQMNSYRQLVTADKKKMDSDFYLFIQDYICVMIIIKKRPFY